MLELARSLVLLLVRLLLLLLLLLLLRWLRPRVHKVLIALGWWICAESRIVIPVLTRSRRIGLDGGINLLLREGRGGIGKGTLLSEWSRRVTLLVRERVSRQLRVVERGRRAVLVV